MTRMETVNWDILPIKARLDQANLLTYRYGLPDGWYWRDTPEKGHELVLLWQSKDESHKLTKL